MSKAPAMPMYWDAYIADTTHLTTEEHGAYLLLLGAMWRRDGSVPDDDRDNARILGLTVAKWRKVKDRLSPFLILEDGHISQKNLRKIWENTQEKIEKNRENGSKGGRPKSSQNNDLAKANGSVSVNPNESIPEPEPEPEEDTNVSSLRDAAEEGPDFFEEFWLQYPHRGGAKKGKSDAKKSWDRAIKAKTNPSQIIQGAMRYAADAQVIRGFAKNPATWINQRCWHDEIEFEPSSYRGGSEAGSGTVTAFASVASRLPRH